MYDYSIMPISGNEYAGAVAGAIAGTMVVYGTILAVLVILTLIANWKLFTKAGEKGWKSIIPIYNVVTLFRVAGLSGWWVLAYLLIAIPIAGPLFAFGLSIYLMHSLAKAFGKGGGFTVGLIFLNTIFVMILAFGSAEYQLDKSTETTE